MNPRFNASEGVVNAINPIYHLVSPLNVGNWMDRVAASATNYVDKAKQGDYDSHGNIERGTINKWLGTPRKLMNELAEDQIKRYTAGDPEGRALVRGSKNYGIDLKGEDGMYQRLDTLVEDVGMGDARYQQLSEAGVSPSQLNLPENTSLVNASLPVFDKHLRKAQAANKKNKSLTDAGINPASIKTQADANEAIRKKQTADEIEKSTAESDAYEKSAKGIREADSHAKGLELSDQQIAASKSTARVNEGTLDLNRVNAENTQTLNLYDRDVDKYRYEDSKYEKGLDRQFEADREDARFAANLETIKLQNAAEMERYEMMLKNDRELRQGDSISDLMGALTMLGGAFMI